MSSHKYEDIIFEIVGQIGIIKFNRPKSLNAFGGKLMVETISAIRELNEHPDTVFTVLTGEGRFFSAGADVKGTSFTVESSNAAEKKLIALSRFSTAVEMLRSIIDHKKVFVLALNGPGVGGGAAWFEGVADIVLAAQGAYLQVPFNALGLVPENGSAISFSQSMGVHRSNDFLMFGRQLTVEELEQWGMVNRIFPKEGFHQSVIKFLEEQLAVNDGKSMMETKRLQNAPLRDARILAVYNSMDALAERFVEDAPLKRFEEKRKLLLFLDTEVIFVDPAVEKWGLKNILVAIGGDVIEVVSPFKPNTTAGRLLSKRSGDGGYMIIMQTLDAAARRAYIESKGLAKVIYSHEHDDHVCIQYHPKGIPGGIMPELDSHAPSPSNPTPLTSRFSPWHAAGADYNAYSAAMQRRAADLHLVGAVCRLMPGNSDTDSAAARRWEVVFGVPRRGSELEFTNARVRFVGGEEGRAEGLESITTAVEGEGRMAGILDRARKEGLDVGDGWVDMLGVRWYFVPASGDGGLKASQGGRDSHL